MANVSHEIKIFAGAESHHLAQQIAQCYGKPLGKVDIFRFSDGEFQPSFTESVRGCDVFIVQSTFPPADNLLELLMMIDAAKRASAHNITAVMPYFGMARQDRKDKPRVSIASRLVADMLTVAGISRIMTMDLHAPQIQGFFNVPVDHLFGMTLFMDYIKNLNVDNMVFCAPDMGATARIKPYLKHFATTPMVVCSKERLRPNEVNSIMLIGDVKGKNVLIIDDMIDTGSTICKVAETIMGQGAVSVRAICTHPVLSGQAYENIEASPLVEVVVTDTIPLQRQSSKLNVVSVAPLFAKAIKRINDHKSMSSLFE